MVQGRSVFKVAAVSAILISIATIIGGIVPIAIERRQASHSPSIGPRLHEFGRPAFWDSQHMQLGDSGYVAAVGPVVYQDEDNTDPDYYSIDVEWRDQGLSLIVFRREFPISELPAGFLDRPIGGIASYSEFLRTVRFRIGDRKEVYVLPDS